MTLCREEGGADGFFAGWNQYAWLETDCVMYGVGILLIWLAMKKDYELSLVVTADVRSDSDDADESGHAVA